MEDNQISNSEEPQNIPDPRFKIGTKVRWNSVSGDYASAYPTDRGVIRGMRYVWSEDLQDWQYEYFIALDDDSPSRQWTQFDWGWQEDLEALLISDSQMIDKSKEETSND